MRPIDVLVGVGWLAQPNVDRWEQGRVPALDRCVQVDAGELPARRPQRIIVISPHNAWACASCGDTGDFLRMDKAGALCQRRCLAATDAAGHMKWAEGDAMAGEIYRHRSK